MPLLWGGPAAPNSFPLTVIVVYLTVACKLTFNFRAPPSTTPLSSEPETIKTNLHKCCQSKKPEIATSFGQRTSETEVAGRGRQTRICETKSLN